MKQGKHIPAQLYNNQGIGSDCDGDDDDDDDDDKFGINA